MPACPGGGEGKGQGEGHGDPAEGDGWEAAEKGGSSGEVVDDRVSDVRQERVEQVKGVAVFSECDEDGGAHAVCESVAAVEAGDDGGGEGEGEDRRADEGEEDFQRFRICEDGVDEEIDNADRGEVDVCDGCGALHVIWPACMDGDERACE